MFPLREWRSSLLWLVVLLSTAYAQDGGMHGFLNFAQSELVVNEEPGGSGFTSVQIPLVREGGVTGQVFAAITIQNASSSDFHAPTFVVSFEEGELASTGTVFIIDDALPEGNETFTLVIDDARNGAEVGLRRTMTLVILASDDPFGAIQFNESSLNVSVAEPGSSSSEVQLIVNRGPGTVGRVTIDYQVTSDSAGMDDLSLFVGQLMFGDGEASQLLTLTVLPDDLPEPNEVFTIRLMNPGGGVTLANDRTVAMVTIEENDSPLSWNVSLVEVVEDIGSVQLLITRGLLGDGTSVGDLSQTTTVSVSTVSGIASAGVDFEPLSTTVTFGPGVTMQTVTIVIIDDTMIEGDETFTVVLSSPSADAVLVPPSTITVIIDTNDNAGGVVSFASPGPVIIREDAGEVGRFIVQRLIGTFGNLSIEWRVTDNVNRQLAVDDFQPPSGTLFIPNGANEATLEIMAFNDNLAEVAEGFSVELVRVVSGDGVISETGVRMASLIIAESDDIYGLVEWGQTLSVADTAPRELRLMVSRSRGDIGIISVDYTILYLPAGTSEGDPNVVTLATGSTQLQGGQSMRDFSVTIPNSMFLDPQATFQVSLTGTILVGGATLLIPSEVSPRIGPRSMVDIAIPSNAANGFIAFEQSSLQVSVEEPASAVTPVSLTVSRSGSYGLAEITWSVTAQSADLTDVGATTGVVTIPHGTSSAQLEVDILPDNMPEVDELFVVMLVTTSQPSSQMIHPSQNLATVTILQNDEAEGVFSISSSSAGPFIVEEDFDGIITIAIVRVGGALTTETISYNIAGGATEIFGGQGFTTFAPNQREETVNLLINNDNIPETNETYTFEISSSNSNILGMPRTVLITIVANDDYAGLFQIDSGSLDQTAVEPRDGESSVATITVERTRGLFTDVNVTWEVLGGGADVSPLGGVVSFEENQRFSAIEINILPDNLPEPNEVLTFRLVDVIGAGSLASSSTQTTLTISQNDDPITFQSSVVSAAEGDTTHFVVLRGGQALDTSDVAFMIDYSSASQDDVIITPTIGTVTFVPGQTEATITAMIVDDARPEERELLTVRLVSASGDAVIVESNAAATLLISPSDDPNGVFQWDTPTVGVAEGDGLILTIDRLGGDFGQVTLSWAVHQLNGSQRLTADVSDVSPNTNLVTFEPGNITADVNINIVDDTLPELAESFEIELSILNIIGDSTDGARIGDIGILTLTVAPSDDPYGLFSLGSNYVEVAEDVPMDNPSLGNLSLPVMRGAGDVGQVTVVWEILPEAVPPYTDLFLVGEGVSGVTDVTPRPHTGTRALNFRGNPGDLLSVPSAQQPDLSTQLTISLWLRPMAGISGVLVAQATDSAPVYQLSLVADSVNFILRFSYLSGSSQRSVETSVAQSTLIDGTWHSLVLSATNEIVSFYINSNFITSRTLTSGSFGGRGQLTVGGVPNGVSTSDFFSGSLQDVRIFPTALTQSQVTSLTSDLAAQSITPISGYHTYPPGVTMATINAATLDDSTPEPSREFVIQLANAVGGARINPSGSITTLNVLKSDMSNGVFGFDPSVVTIATTEGQMLSLPITRSGGAFEGVSVFWEITQDGELANMDFVPPFGSVNFTEGQLVGLLELTVVNELVPELLETFTVTLTSAVANDNQTSSTPLSGASINASFSQSTLTVAENDSPYGLFQFVTSPPLPGVTITPATEQPQLFVDESVGVVTVYVVRAQGRLGDASVEYITSEGSALSGGGAPDFVPTAGSLTYSGEVVVQIVNVSLIDDTIPELQKTFYVNLTNPSGTVGTPDLGVGSSLAVHIQPSDDAFGRFNFNSDSRARVVAEQPGGTPITLSVLREGGVFGDVALFWTVSQSMGMQVDDIHPTQGTLVFSEGSNEENIELTIRDDLSAELLEVFTVQLLNVTVGASLGLFRAAVITVQASDHPYGLFTFAPPPSEVLEGQEVVVTVIREFGTVGQVTVGVVSLESTDLRLAALQLNIRSLEQMSRLATPGVDFTRVDTTVTFEPGETSAILPLSIQDDSLPELGELLFLALTQATLNTSSVDSVDTSVLPQVAPGNESISVIEINENDDARGVVELSQAVVRVFEPAEQILNIVRREGSFGEISVQWEVVPVTASQSDYTPSGGTVIFAPNESERPLPLAVVDDSDPEFDEVFNVRLVGVSGSAILGDVIVSMVTIEANDDPNGALEFALTSLEVAEPDSSPTFALFMVQRVGGAVGVVEVFWNVTSLDGSDASSDVLPVTGRLQFVSNVRQQTIRLSVLPDDEPERTEVFMVQLGSVSGGARVEVTRSTATLTIPENDSPYGILSFVSAISIAMETGDNRSSVAMVPVVRSFGTFGDLELTFSVQSADPATLALASGTPLLDFYTSPMSNTALSTQAQLQILQGSLLDCARACLSNEACRSFSITGNDCELYFTSVSQGAAAVVSIGTDYYEKIQESVLPFYQAVASEGNDFISVVGQTVIVPNGANTIAIPVTVIGDRLPELNESLAVRLVDVQLISGSLEGTSSGAPALGSVRETSLVILENDDPRGRFAIFGSNSASVTRLSESEAFDFGVSLTVERQGGTLGEVSVQWTAVNSTATEGEDYTGTGAVLTFPDGVARATIALTILADDIPERDETIQVVLSNPMGGASVGDMGSTLIIINANDQGAGVVGFDPLSRSAVIGEGESGGVEVVRSVSALGMVRVSWQLTTGDGEDPTTEFVSTTGTATFQDGDNSTQIVISVRADTQPELEERYTLTLTSVETLSPDVAESGEAVLNELATMATVTIQASNNPHGVVEFQSSSVQLSEGGTLGVAIVRQFGAIGDIDVGYNVTTGSLRTLALNESLATPTSDFMEEVGVVRLVDGQQSAVINVIIVDDVDPELDEIFLVLLTSVTLVGSAGSTLPPSIGSQNVSEVVIPANDSPQGEMTFAQAMYEITEETGRFQLPILRVQGVLGSVSVVYFVTNGLAINGEDFRVSQLQELVFAPGQTERIVSIEIVNDAIPEVPENFCVQLQLPRAGVILGNITTTCITISANDDAYGVFSFESSSLISRIRETSGTATDDNVAELRVVRGGGLFGQITVPFEVRAVNTGEVTTADLSPLMGSALVFNQDDSFRILQVEAIQDTVPELDEIFTITLLPPIELGRLATNNITATITIESNQDPYGVFELSVVGGTTAIEEEVVLVDYLLSRTFGTFGEVSVTMETIDGTAVFSSGASPVYAAVQSLSGGEVWHSLSVGGSKTLLVLGGETSAQLLAWRGVYTTVQILPATRVSAITSLSPQPGSDLLLVASGGSPGNRQLSVDVYRFTDPESVALVQQLPGLGVTDLVSFSAGGQWYVLVANGEDNTGSNIVDSTVWWWNGTAFVMSQSLPTIGASSADVFTFSDSLYVAVGSSTDSRSPVFVWREGSLRLHHNFPSSSVQDVLFIPPSSLAVASQTISLLVWSIVSQGFQPNSTLPATQPIRLELFNNQLFIANANTPSQVFTFQNGTWIQNSVPLPVSRHLHPFMINSMFYLASTGSSRSVVMETLLIDTSVTDFFSRRVNLTFAPEESQLRFSVRVVNDEIPEIDESFTIQLSNPVGGARIGTNRAVTTTILTNDDAHGLIGFADGSLSRIVEEGSTVELDVVRMGGAFGMVSVAWNISGSHSDGEITPSQGTVTFPDGQSSAIIPLTITSDTQPELSEVTFVTLNDVIINGVPEGGDTSRGATIISTRQQSVLTVQASDAPHGVVSWSPTVVMATEAEETDSVVMLMLVREFGSIGAIVIEYSTSVASAFPDNRRADPLTDFVPTSGEAVMGDGVIETSVGVTILHDNLAELTESFFVNITNVRLVNEADRQGSISLSPRAGAEAVEVQITENDDSRGALSFIMATASVNEVIGGNIQLEVRREGGTFGTVGVEFTAVGVSASSLDFDPPSGSIMLESGVDVGFIEINITNDPEPENDETFEVRLVNGLGGATIGNFSSILVTILSNDDINGVFSYTDTSLLFLIPESTSPTDSMGVVTLTVQRMINFVGVVTVYWEVSEDGRMDLEPTSGNLTFVPPTAALSFSVRAINDQLPEQFEAFTVSLVRTEGGGRIVDPRDARIAIQSSDDPSGVVGFIEYPQGIIVNEGAEFQVDVVRSSGTQGTVTLTWAISPPDTTVFLITTDTVVLTDGQSDTTFTIQTLSDTTPEVARLFSLDLVSASLASIDVNSTHIDLIITASDNPHGILQFSSDAVSVMEGEASVGVTVVRGVGLIGDLRVNFDLQYNSADTNDFNISTQTLMIPSGQPQANLLVNVFEDSLPEAAETFTISISSVELTGNEGRNFDFSGDPALIDQPPIVGTNNMVIVTIQPSDDPFGTITLTSISYSASEGGVATITLSRVGGALGVATATYATIDGSAVSPTDYLQIAGIVEFLPGQRSASVNITIVDDNSPELEESFTFSLTSSTTAALGSITMATVIIPPSDNPFGAVGFEPNVVANGIQLANPTIADGPTAIMLNVTREGGVVGSSEVTWEVRRSSDGEFARDDVSPIGAVLTLQNGQSHTSIELFVLPSDADEVQETYTVSLVLASNNVLVNSDLSSVSITVAQMGNPQGMVSFIGDVLSGQRVSEGTTLSLPVTRIGSSGLEISINYIVTRVSGSGLVSDDVTPATGSVMMPLGLTQVNLDLSIVSDGMPELDEAFQVILTGTNAVGVGVTPQADTAPFTIIANDSPFGQFSLSSVRVMLDSTEPLVSRSLRYTIERSLGLIGDITVTINHNFTDQSTSYVPTSVTRVLSSGTSSLNVALNIVQGAYLAPGLEFTAQITSATVTTPSQFTGQSADIVDTPIVAVVTSDVSNTLISFDQSSLSASANDADGSVELTVNREGILDVVAVQWSVGALVGGVLTPPTGSLTITPNQRSVVIPLTATPTTPHGLSEVFSVTLTAQSQLASLQARVDENADTAVIEPWGVVQLGSTEFSGVEGQVATIAVWRRFGSLGEITVSGVASLATSLPPNTIGATPGVDFPATIQSATIGDGQTIGYINVSLLNNFATSELKVFTFTLTSVSRTATPTGSFLSPRLSSSNLIGRVTIVDDEGGSGVFQLNPTTASISEGGVLSFTVMREGGSAGAVSVGVRTVDGTAVGGEDFTLLNQQLDFANGVTLMPLSLPILDDIVPEADERFRVQLVAGSGAIIDPVNSILDVTIPSNDNPGGVFTISTSSPLTLIDVTSPMATITVERSGGLVVPVVITWNVDPPVSFLSATSGSVTFLTGQTVPNDIIQLSLIPNSVPAEGATLVLRISSPTPGVVLQTTEIMINALARPNAVFQIIQSHRNRVATAPGSVAITIQRTDGLQLDTMLTYNVHSDQTEPVRVGALQPFELAQPGVHFARIEDASIRFEPGVAEQTISLSVISVPNSPLAFFMDIQGTSDGSDSSTQTATIIVLPASPLSDLYSLYFQSLNVATSQDLDTVSSTLVTVVMTASGSNSDQVLVLRLTIDQLVNSTLNTINTPNIQFSNTYVSNILDVFNHVLSETSFTGQNLIVQSMRSFAYSLVEDEACPASNTEVLMSFTRSEFVLEGLKISPILLRNRQFLSSDNADYVQFPSQSLSTTQPCLTVHFIEFRSGQGDQIFGQPTFRSKVMSVGVANREVQPTSDSPLRYRIHTSQSVGTGTVPTSNDCVRWMYPSSATPTGQWSSALCRSVTEYGNVLLEDFVLCECSQFGDLSVSNNITLGYSWTWPAGVSAGLVAIVMIFVILVHLCYLSRTQLATRILISLCLSVFLFQIMLLIDVFASPVESLSDEGCVALGVLLHFTVVLQFVWIMALAIALWVNFMGFTDGREPLIAYIIPSWGLAIIIVVLTILIGHYGVPLPFNELYFHTRGQLCFIPSLPASLLSVVLPVVLCILIVIAFLSHSCVYWSRWEDYHNIYHDSFNKTEIPLLLVFFALIFFTGLAGYLHVYITVVYTYAAFVALNVIQGLYALVVYCFVSWHTLTRKHKKFILGNEVEPLSIPEEPDYLSAMENLSTSGHKMDPQEEWAEFENDSDITPVLGVGVNHLQEDVDGSQYSLDNPSEGTGKDSHLDDLMFMLKTQTYHSDKEGLKGTFDQPQGMEELQLRPISIADTHL